MILSASWMFPVSSPSILDGAVLVNNDEIQDLGTIRELVSRYPKEEVRDFPGKVLLPGFVNSHSHLELSVLRGYLEDLSFWNWIQRLVEAKHEVLNHEEIKVSAEMGACEAIRAGITTVGDAMEMGASFDALLTSGLRGILYQEVFSPRADEADDRISSLHARLVELERRRLVHSRNRESSTSTRADRIILGVSPHAPYTVSGALFQKVHEYTQARKIPVCIHVAESKEEDLLLREGTGPMSVALRSRGIEWVAPECSPIQYLQQLGVISQGTLLIHCVQLIPADIPILRKTGAGIAHCPKSNWKLKHGYMNLRRLIQAGIPIGLGGDSVASNNTMDLFEEMRFALFNPSWCTPSSVSTGSSQNERQFSVEQALHMATLGGANVLGLSHLIGSIEVGKKADLIVVDLSGSHTIPVFSPITALVCSARASDVVMTMVGGEILWENGKLSTLDEEKFLEKTQPILEKLNARSASYSESV